MPPRNKERRVCLVSVNLSQEEYELVEKEADRLDLSKADIIRRGALRVIRHGLTLEPQTLPPELVKAVLHRRERPRLNL